MKILVFDDSATNRSTARAQLKDHELTVVGTYDEAQRLLTPTVDESKALDIFETKFGDRVWNKHQGLTSEAVSERFKFYEEQATKQATAWPTYDVVLTDLLVPASDQKQGPDGQKFVGQEMPLGIFIALLAAKNGVKKVAVLTDSNHHNHPASACFDAFHDKYNHEVPFIVGEGEVVLVNGYLVDYFEPSDLGTPLTYEQHKRSETKVRAKNWSKLLEILNK